MNDQNDQLNDQLNDQNDSGATPTPIHVGFVALIGKPNVGKSTLLNTLLEQKVAIVSPRPQTTRVPLRGILTQPGAQIIFIDTPGIHEPRHQLGQFMVKLAHQSLPDADVVCMMVDLSRPPSNLDRSIAAEVSQTAISSPRLLVLNKVDLRPHNGPFFEDYRALGTWDMEIAVSARTGAGIPTLIEEIVKRLPLGEPLYPEDWVVDQSVQHLAAESVREKVLYFTNQEVPHAVAVEVEEWQEREQATYIRMTIVVEKPSQKRILIGSGGDKLKQIGTAARADIERMLGHAIYLDLWVKVRANWRNDPASLGWLGYDTRDYS